MIKGLADTYARRLGSLLEIEKKSQKDLANHLGISSQSVQGWVSGKSIPKDSARIAVTAKYLGADPSWLAFGDENKNDDGDMKPRAGVRSDRRGDGNTIREVRIKEVRSDDTREDLIDASSMTAEVLLSMNVLLPGHTRTLSKMALAYNDDKLFAVVVVAQLYVRDGDVTFPADKYYKHLWHCLRESKARGLTHPPLLIVYGMTSDNTLHDPSRSAGFVDFVREGSPAVNIYGCRDPKEASQIIHRAITGADIIYSDNRRDL